MEKIKCNYPGCKNLAVIKYIWRADKKGDIDEKIDYFCVDHLKVVEGNDYPVKTRRSGNIFAITENDIGEYRNLQDEIAKRDIRIKHLEDENKKLREKLKEISQSTLI